MENKYHIRFISKVKKTKTCWLWKSTISNYGYGIYWDGKRNVGSHRYSYEMFKGKIPKGLHLDHLCRVHECVNPDHLEAVTCRENILRGKGIASKNAKKTVCKNGHKNWVRWGNRRFCLTCERIRGRKFLRRSSLPPRARVNRK